MAVIIPVQADDAQFQSVMAGIESSARKSSKVVKDELKKATDAAESLGESAEVAADGIGKVGSGAAKVSGALDLLVPGLGNATRNLADIADVGEVVAGVATSLGVTLEGLIAAAAPLALIVGGVALAWNSYSESVKEATEFQERLNTALGSVDDIATATSGEVNQLKNNMGLLSDAELDNLKIKEAWAARLEKGTASLNEEKKALEDQMAAIGTASDEYLNLQDRLHEVNGLIDTATKLNKQGEEAALANAEVTREKAESEKVLAERAKKAAEAERDATEAERERAAESDRLLRSLLRIADAEMKRAKTLEVAKKSLDASYAAANMGIATEEERIKLAAQASREAAVAAANEAQAAATSSDERKAIARKLAETLSLINQGEVKDLEEAEKQKTEAAEKEAKKRADDAKRAAEEIQRAQLDTISGVQGGLEGIATLIGGPVAGAITGLIMNLGGTVDSLIEQIASIPDILTSIPQLAVKLVQAIVDAVPAIVAAIPILIDGIIDAIPTIITSLIVGLIAAIPSLIETAIHLFVTFLLAQSGWLVVTITIELIKALATELPKVFADLGRWLAQSWKRFVSGDLARDFADLFRIPVQDAIELAKNAILKLKEAVQTFFQYWLDAWKEILTLGMANTSLDGGGSKAWDATKEVFTLGLAKTSYGDSPGIVRAGPQGMTVQASPGDYVNIGRNRQQLLDRALSGSGAAHPPAAVTPAPVLVLNDHVRQWDKLGYRLARTGGLSVDISNRTTKNARSR